MCMHTDDKAADGVKKVADKDRKNRSAEVPLGEGLADQAKISILSRRERIEKALADAGA